jgi:hypothetical protein
MYIDNMMQILIRAYLGNMRIPAARVCRDSNFLFISYFIFNLLGSHWKTLQYL